MAFKMFNIKNYILNICLKGSKASLKYTIFDIFHV